MNIRLIPAWLSVLAIMVTAQALADSVGYLVLEQGIIKVRREMTDHIYKEIGEKVPVNNRDEIQTGPQTRLGIYLREEQEVIRLFSNSFFTLNLVDEDASQMSLPVGKIRCVVTPSSSQTRNLRRRFRVKTATAHVEVKGTDFVVQTSGTETNVLTLEGTISFASLERPEVTVDVPRNQASKVGKIAVPTVPVEVSAEVREKITTEDTAPAWDEVEFGAIKETAAPATKAEKKSEEEAAEPEEKEEPSAENEPVADEAQEATTTDTVPEDVLDPMEEVIEIIESIENAEGEVNDAREVVDQVEEAATQKNKRIIFTIIEE